MQALQVRVETERAPSTSDVLVRAIANESRINDGRPVAGFFVRRRYHGDTFNIQHPSEFSAAWMEFVEDPPEEWLPVIKKKYPQWKAESFYEPATPDQNRSMTHEDVTAKIGSGDFDYSNGAPKRRGRPPKLKLS